MNTTIGKCFFGYWALIGVVFTFLSGPDTARDIVKVNASSTARVGNSYSGTFGELDDLTMEVSIVYCQVLGAMALVAAALIYFEGKKERWLAAQIPLVGIMMKHITVDGLIPPVPPMVLCAITLAVAAMHATGKGPAGVAAKAQYVFAGQSAINLLAFVADPAQVVLDTWPSATGASLEAGVLFVGVVQFYMAAFLALTFLEGAEARFACMVLVLGQWYRDIIVLDSGPPMPVRVVGLALAAATAYEYFGAAGKGKGKKA